MNGAIEVAETPALAKAAARLSDYFVLTKPGITFMVGVTAAAGFTLASTGVVNLTLLFHVVVGTLLSSAGSAALNMLLERRTDAKMERTRNRPLPSGRIAPAEALTLGLALAVLGTAYLAILVNPLTAALGAATILSYLVIYTPLKKRTSISTLVGAVPGALPPVMGWAAASGAVDPGAVALFLILFFWQLPHFLALAWKYREDFARAGFPMLAVQDADGSKVGRQVVLQTMALIVASLLPVGFGLAGPGYLVAAILLGAGFLGFGIAFAAERSRERASRLFRASILYLPILLGILVLA